MDLYREALARFADVYERARTCGVRDHTALALATADGAGRPSVRVVLLKGHDERGFVFYTNTRSRKGRHLAEQPWAALTWYWEPIGEQVRVEGRATPVSDAEADAYWATRPRESQIGAWASEQSSPIDSRESLERRVAELEARFGGAPVPRPPHWSGYRVAPEWIEFWTFREHRLHDRICYAREGGEWTRARLQP